MAANSAASTSLITITGRVVLSPAMITTGSMPDKGPRVSLDYDQAALDAAYDQAAYAPNREQLINRRIRDSELARHRIGEPERVAYGSAVIERSDIYRAVAWV
jgi:hypothetical protein